MYLYLLFSCKLFDSSIGNCRVYMMDEWPSLDIYSIISDGGWTYTGTGKFGPITKLETLDRIQSRLK